MLNINALTEDRMRILLSFSLILLLITGCATRYEGLDDLRNQIAIHEAQIAVLSNQVRHFDSETAQETSNLIQTQVQAVSQERDTPPQILPRLPDSMTLDEMSRLYNQGLRHYEARDFAAAIRDFTVIATHSPNHELAANAIYWMGESYFALADFTAARAEFQRIQEQHPNSNKFIDAQVKIAMTWLRQGRRDLARGILEAIRRDFPNYERMSVVDQQLRLIRG